MRTLYFILVHNTALAIHRAEEQLNGLILLDYLVAFHAMLAGMRFGHVGGKPGRAGAHAALNATSGHACATYQTCGRYERSM